MFDFAADTEINGAFFVEPNLDITYDLYDDISYMAFMLRFSSHLNVDETSSEQISTAYLKRKLLKRALAT